ncbi:AAA domain-containing protein, putative AbiEii toxin, Type IV TA system [Pseudomonas sp. ok272]|nr:AAA domain-containing protein, putative AbiEii toxin, Type IV TA system [Pseudomonas sp. ok272]SFN27716.1 AAA domain-containing protein, putative AbiEii toxin, Type IV TA system [Pseudomonas sp. ok602]
MSIELAEQNLIFGSPEANRNKYFRWQDKPATRPLNDYEKLMVYLFSDETEENAKYKVVQRKSTTKLEPPLTKMDKVKQAWERILPHRELVVGGLRIQTQVRGDASKTYNSSEMSDGERVIFYLIGQCLAAPQDGIVVIDEPELHLHKSVQAPLWAEIERLRPDCLFVYLTHDVDFAVAQEGAQRVWLKSYDGTSWEWELIEDNDNLPDDLLIEVLGSRKPVVFIEGVNGSHDVSLYREILTGFLVIPRGSCDQVIQAVRALRSNIQLHHLQVYGLIDRDRRTAPEIAALQADNIYTLDVAEVENLFCTQEVLALVSTRLARDATADFNQAVTQVFKQLKTELDTQVSLRVIAEVKFKLNCFNASARGESALSVALQQLTQGIDISALYAQFDGEFQAVINAADYRGLLRLYNRKSLPTQIGNALGLKAGELVELVVRLVRTDERSAVIAAIRSYFGAFAHLVN